MQLETYLREANYDFRSVIKLARVLKKSTESFIQRKTTFHSHEFDLCTTLDYKVNLKYVAGEAGTEYYWLVSRLATNANSTKSTQIVEKF